MAHIQSSIGFYNRLYVTVRSEMEFLDEISFKSVHALINRECPEEHFVTKLQATQICIGKYFAEHELKIKGKYFKYRDYPFKFNGKEYEIYDKWLRVIATSKTEKGAKQKITNLIKNKQ